MADRYPMTSMAEAENVVLANAGQLPCETVKLLDALGKVLAEDITNSAPFPPFPASIKDGYAIVASDGPGEYDLAGSVRAAATSQRVEVKTGTVAYVTTGAPVPIGADAVIGIEKTSRSDSKIKIHASVKVGADIRPVGSDIARGETILSRGAKVGPAEIGLLATIGVVDVSVYRTPRVGVLSTGDELVDAQEADLQYGQIRDANRCMLLAAVKEAGAQAVDLGIVQDQENALESKLNDAIHQSLDILVTSGGVSMGDKDYMKALLEARGTVHFGRVKMKPGKPLTFATVPTQDARDPLLVFAVPGNPVSAVVTFNLLVVPAMRQMSGWIKPGLRRVHTRLGKRLKLDPERPEYHRAALAPAAPGMAPGLVAESTGRQISCRLLSMRGADALLELPQGGGVLEEGTVCSALLMGNASHAQGLFAPMLNPLVDAPVSPAQTQTQMPPAAESAAMTSSRCDAFAFQQLLGHLQARTDVQNIDLMNLSGFCRNCLSKWYFVGARKVGGAWGAHLSYDEACAHIYGMGYKQWKQQYQSKASDEQMALYESSKAKHAKHDEFKTLDASAGAAQPTATAAADAADAADADASHIDVCGCPIEELEAMLQAPTKQDLLDPQSRVSAFAFQQLLGHLQARTDVQNIDLMNLSGFCRNCLSKWYFVGARKVGGAWGAHLSYDEACAHIYGMGYKQWKQQYQSKASDEQMALYESSKAKHAKHDEFKTLDASAGAAQPTATAAADAADAVATLLPATAIRVGVLTVSDRAHAGAYTDQSGPAIETGLCELLPSSSLSGKFTFSVAERCIVPDEQSMIQEKLVEWSEGEHPCHLVLTTGYSEQIDEFVQKQQLPV